MVKLARQRKLPNSYHEYTIPIPKGVNITQAVKFSNEEYTGLFFPNADAFAGQEFSDSEEVIDVHQLCGARPPPTPSTQHVLILLPRAPSNLMPLPICILPASQG